MSISFDDFMRFVDSEDSTFTFRLESLMPVMEHTPSGCTIRLSGVYDETTMNRHVHSDVLVELSSMVDALWNAPSFKASLRENNNDFQFQNYREVIHLLTVSWLHAYIGNLESDAAFMEYASTVAKLQAKKRMHAQAREQSLIVAKRREQGIVEDVGPWMSSKPLVIQSLDFQFDAQITITGDFKSDAEREAYTKFILQKLNE